jgi:hypothetical protein
VSGWKTSDAASWNISLMAGVSMRMFEDEITVWDIDFCYMPTK